MVATLLDAEVEHFAEHGWLLTRSHDDVAAVRGVGRRGRVVARTTGLAPPPRAHRRRAAAVPHARTSCRSTTGCARLLTTGRMVDDRVRAARRAGRALQGEDQLQAAGRRGLLAAPGRARLPLRRDPRVVHGRGGRRARSTTGASRSCRAATTSCSRSTTPAASAPTSSTR